MSTRLSRRQVLRASFFAAGSVFLAACQPKVVEVDREVTRVVEKEVQVDKEVTRVVEKEVEKVITARPTDMGTVNINLFARSSNLELIENQLAASNFAENNPSTKVEFLGVPSEEEYLTKLLTMAAGGNMGSVFWASIGLSNYQQFAAKNLMLDLSPMIDAEGFDIDDFYPKAVDALGFEGNRLYGLPWLVHPGIGAMIYNVDLMEAEGVAVPEDGWSWEDLVSKAQALTKDTVGDGRTDQWGFVNTRQNYLGYALFIRAQDGWEISKDGKTALFNTPEAKAGLTWLYDSFTTWKFQPPAQSIEKSISDMFSNGKIGMQLTGMWGQYQAKAIEAAGKFTVRSVPLPRSPKGQRPSLFEVDTMSIASMLRDELAPYAWELLKATCTTEAGALQCAMNCSGGRTSSLAYAQQQQPLHPSVLPYYDVLAECMEYRGAWNYRSSEYSTTVKAALDPLWLGDAEPTQAFLDDATAQMQEVLDMPMTG